MSKGILEDEVKTPIKDAEGGISFDSNNYEVDYDYLHILKIGKREEGSSFFSRRFHSKARGLSSASGKGTPPCK